MKRSNQQKEISIIRPKSFEAVNHYYPKVLNASLHPLVYYFMHLDMDSIIKRYCHLHPIVNPKVLRKVLQYKSSHFYWAGADLFYVATQKGDRKIVVIETNSSPSGQKSMPLLEENEEMGGYKRLIKCSFLPLLNKKKKLPKGGKLAVLYDKNKMEASGYAAALADYTNEIVYLVPYYDEVNNENIEWKNGILTIRKNKKNIPLRAIIRYVTQKPWNRIPTKTKTFVYNPILACLAGGRNKLVAAKAYEDLNDELHNSGLKILTPYTVREVKKKDIPRLVRRFEGHAVIKVPYLNAGQGVFTITNTKELQAFMTKRFQYDQFIVQSLIGDYTWSSKAPMGKFFHIGTMPNKKNNIFVSDIRLMVMSTDNGFKPVAVYCRRAKKNLKRTLTTKENSWDMLGTNLSYKGENGSWESDTNRLMLMDRKDFNKLGIGIDELIECYIQTVLSVIAIDKMAKKLVGKEGNFRRKYFHSVNQDAKLRDEIY